MHSFPHSLPRPLKWAFVFGTLLFFAGLVVMSLWWLVAPHPQTLDEWRTMISHVRTAFFLTVFAGVLIALFPALAIVWRGRAALTRPGWFRWTVMLLAIALPAMHLYGRSRMLALREALGQQNLLELPDRWNDVGAAFAIALGGLLAIALWSYLASRGGHSPAVTRSAPAPAAPDIQHSRQRKTSLRLPLAR